MAVRYRSIVAYAPSETNPMDISKPSSIKPKQRLLILAVCFPSFVHD